MVRSDEASRRLASLDVFRGVVILAMLIVNNLGDHASTGYFWKHANWIDPIPGHPSVLLGSFHSWWQQINASDSPIITALTQLPLWRHCTLADFVMPCFMLIIGLAMPFSIASQKVKGKNRALVWLRVLKRAAILVCLGWILVYFRDQFAQWFQDKTGTVRFTLSLGLDVLQLLGLGYLVARILYVLPKYPRVVVIALLLNWHWTLLRFWPQGDMPRGTFTQQHNAIGYIYDHAGWMIFRTWEPVSGLSMSAKGLLSVPPAAGMMLIGTLMSDWIRRDGIIPVKRVSVLAITGVILMVAGLLWAFDLPFNKPRWTPCYLLWCAGAGAILISIFHAIVDIHRVRGWTHPFIVLGSNALAAYFISILAKILLLNTPRIDEAKRASLIAVRYGTGIFITAIVLWITWQAVKSAKKHLGHAAWAIAAIGGLPIVVLWRRFLTTEITMSENGNLINLTEAVMRTLKTCLGNSEGGWTFTVAFVLFWYAVLEMAYRRRIFWRL